MGSSWFFRSSSSSTSGFCASYRSYDLLAKAVPAYGFIYPFLELALGLAWAFEGGTYRVALSTVVLMGFSAIGVIAAVTRKQQINALASAPCSTCR